MADDDTPTTEPPEDASVAPPAQPDGTDNIPYERLQKAHRQAKDAQAAAKAAEKRAADLERLLEERENAGLPELEQARKRADAAEKRAEEHERRAAEADVRVANLTKASWVTAAAREAGFADPSDAAAFIDLAGVEDEKDAGRAVKRVAQAKPHLIKPEGPVLPGKVLENGRPPVPGQPLPVGSVTEAADRQWAEEMAPMLQKMVTYDTSTRS